MLVCIKLDILRKVRISLCIRDNLKLCEGWQLSEKCRSCGSPLTCRFLPDIDHGVRQASTAVGSLQGPCTQL